MWTWQLDHFRDRHGLDPREVQDLRETLAVWVSTEIPARRALLDRAEPHLREVRAWLDTPEGRSYEAGMAAVSAHPYALALEAELAARGRRLAKLKASRPVPAPEAAPAAAVRQLDWDDIAKMATLDRAKHPEHWTDAPSTGESIPGLLE